MEEAEGQKFLESQIISYILKCSQSSWFLQWKMSELNNSHDRFSFYVLSDESGDIHILKLLIVLSPGNCFTDALLDLLLPWFIILNVLSRFLFIYIYIYITGLCILYVGSFVKIFVWLGTFFLCRCWFRIKMQRQL